MQVLNKTPPGSWKISKIFMENLFLWFVIGLQVAHMEWKNTQYSKKFFSIPLKPYNLINMLLNKIECNKRNKPETNQDRHC